MQNRNFILSYFWVRVIKNLLLQFIQSSLYKLSLYNLSNLCFYERWNAEILPVPIDFSNFFISNSRKCQFEFPFIMSFNISSFIYISNTRLFSQVVLFILKHVVSVYLENEFNNKIKNLIISVSNYNECLCDKKLMHEFIS